MQKTMSLLLACLLLLAPAIHLRAEERPAERRPGELDQPDLPEAAAEDEVPADVLQGMTTTAEPEVPKEVLATPGKPKVDRPESPFKWKNFTLGFLGGAVVGGAAGVLFLSRADDGSLDTEKAKIMGPAVGAGTGLVFGLLSLLLGATTPEAAKPPSVEGFHPLSTPGTERAELGVHLDFRF